MRVVTRHHFIIERQTPGHAGHKLPFFGFDQNDAIGAAGAIRSRSSRTFQNLDIFDVFGIQIREHGNSLSANAIAEAASELRIIHAHAIDDDQRLLITVDSRSRAHIEPDAAANISG